MPRYLMDIRVCFKATPDVPGTEFPSLPGWEFFHVVEGEPTIECIIEREVEAEGADPSEAKANGLASVEPIEIPGWTLTEFEKHVARGLTFELDPEPTEEAAAAPGPR